MPQGVIAMRKNVLLIFGALLIILGVAALVVGRISYSTQQEALKVGPMEATVETRKIITLPPVLSGLVLVGGILLVYTGWKKA
jgi:hypothetical protein